MTDEEENTTSKNTKRKGCLGWLWRLGVIGLVLLFGFLAWLNGPGIRLLGPKLAKHFIEDGMLGENLRIEGTLLGGLDVYDLELSTDGAIERLAIKRFETDYRFSEIISGKLRGLSGEGIHLDLRLEPSKEKDKQPVDFAQLGRMLNGVRNKILPLNLNLDDVSFSLAQDGERILELEPSDFSHRPGDDVVELELGRIIDGKGGFTQKQKTSLVWEKGRMTLDQIELLTILGVSGLTVMLPENGEIAAEGAIRLGEAILRLDVGKGLSDLQLEMIEGELDIGGFLGEIGVKMPIKGQLKFLEVDLKQVFPEWQKAVGTAEVFIESFAYDRWDVAELSAGMTLDEGRFSAKLAGVALGSQVTVNGEGAFERADLVSEDFMMKRISGDLSIARVGEVLRGLDAKLDMPTTFEEFPESEIGGTWAVDFDDAGFGAVEGELSLKATQADATPIRLNARFDAEAKAITVKNLVTDGMVFSGSYGLASQAYEAKQVMENFDSTRLLPWLEGLGKTMEGSCVASGKWEGSGNLADGRMRGELTDLKALWKWNAPESGAIRPPVSAMCEKFSYEWPGTLEIDGLVAETDGQTVKLDAKLANQELVLEKFIWLDDEEQLAQGQGKLPVPEDYSKWQEFIKNDSRPLDLMLNSKTLPLAKLRPWVKGLDQIDDKATGRLDLRIAGSLMAPEVSAVVEIRDVSVPSRSELPTMDVTLNVEARDGRAIISAAAIAPDFEPATMNATMAFLPKKWAEDPGSIMTEEVSGSLALPRINLSRFQSLIPGAAKLGGVVEGEMAIVGTVGEPDISGELKLSGGEFRMTNSDIPALDGIDLQIGTDLKYLTIKGGVADIEGGNITIEGAFGLKADGDAEGVDSRSLDFTIRAAGIPVVRNDFLIVRTNADMRVQGTMGDAKVTGEFGIIDSVFYKDMELIPIGTPFLEPSAAKLPSIDTPDNPGAVVPAPFSEWAVDLNLKTIDPILIRGNLGTGQVDVSLKIGGEVGNPKPNGTVRLSNAVARLPFSTLKVGDGTATFTPQTGFDPILEMRGTAEPRPYQVQVYVNGRASDPQVLLTSQPPLPENEIMTLIATGTTTSGLENSQAASSRATKLLIEELRQGRFLFGKQLRPLLSLLDNVDFSIAESDPYDSDSYNSATVELSEKLYVSAGLGEEGDQRFLAIWRVRFR